MEAYLHPVHQMWVVSFKLQLLYHHKTALVTIQLEIRLVQSWSGHDGNQWWILIQRSDLPEVYAMQNCTDPLDLASVSGLATADYQTTAGSM